MWTEVKKELRRCQTLREDDELPGVSQSGVNFYFDGLCGHTGVFINITALCCDTCKTLKQTGGAAFVDGHGWCLHGDACQEPEEPSLLG